MRSLLFVPAHKEELVKKAINSDADAVIFDLEDSCPGEANKEFGINNILKYKDSSVPKTITRVSEADQIPLVDTEYIMWPKAEWDQYIPWIVGYKSKIILLIETALGVLGIEQMIQKNLVYGLAFGNEDYLADTGCSNYDFAQGMIVNYAKAYEKFAIDSVSIDLHDLTGLEKACQESVNKGFDGKLCIHPKEIPTIHRYFTPTVERYEYACKIISLYDQAVRDGSGVAIIGGVYVAPPMVKMAKKIIDKYENYTQKH